MINIDNRGKAAAKREYFEKMLDAKENNMIISLDEQLDIIIRAYLSNLTPPEEKPVNGRYRGHTRT